MTKDQNSLREVFTMLDFGANPVKQKKLEDKMRVLGIREEDLEEKFVRSSGKGGQNVNKTSTCVYLRHIPTNIIVKCQEERYQALNRFLARRVLVSKIENLLYQRRSEEQKRFEKIRRQKRKRSKRAREKMLRDKKMVSQKKKSREFIRGYTSESM